MLLLLLLLEAVRWIKNDRCNCDFLHVNLAAERTSCWCHVTEMILNSKKTSVRRWHPSLFNNQPYKPAVMSDRCNFTHLRIKCPSSRGRVELRAGPPSMLGHRHWARLATLLTFNKDYKPRCRWISDSVERRASADKVSLPFTVL